MIGSFDWAALGARKEGCLVTQKWKTVMKIVPKFTKNNLQEGKNLVGSFNPFEKYESKWESSPNRVEHKQISETTTQFYISRRSRYDNPKLHALLLLMVQKSAEKTTWDVSNKS